MTKHHTNGHAERSTAELAEMITLIPLMPQGEPPSRLREGFPYGPEYNFYHGLDAYIADAGDLGRVLLGRPAGADTSGGKSLLFATDEDLDRIRALSRQLHDENMLVQGFVQHLQNFTVRTGYVWEAQPAKGLATDGVAQELAAQAQEVIDEFGEVNDWPGRERSCLLRAIVDGEVFLRHFPQMDGSTVTRFIEPEQVRKPPGSQWNWDFGKLTDPCDIETALAYAVCYHPSHTEYEEVAAEQVSHLKRNTRECVKRGVSDLYSTAEAFRETAIMLRNMVHCGGAQSAIAWLEEYSGIAGDTVLDKMLDARDKNTPRIQDPISGKIANDRKYDRGSVLHTDKGRQYKPGPIAANTTQHIAIVQAALRALGNRWCAPEYMSGDASNANYASTLVAGAPFVIAIESEQAVFARFFLRSQWIAVRNAASAGRFVVAGRSYTAKEIERLIDLHWTPPQIAISNKSEEAQIDQMDLVNRVVSVSTIRAKRGYDDDQERRNMQEEPITAVPGRVTDVDPLGNPLAPEANQQGGGAGGFFPRLATKAY